MALIASRSRRLPALALAGVLALSTVALTPALVQAQDDAPPVSTASDDLGTYLVDSAGMTLYYFVPDGPGMSVCEGQCLENWPPLNVEEGAEPTGDDSVSGTLGVITATDGSVQVTYRGRPLYLFVGDAAAGDTNGQGLNDVWFVAAEDGSLPNATPPEDPDLTLEAAESDLGTFITGADGRTAYFFAPDGPGMSVCEGQCLENWPPVTLPEGGGVAAGEGVPGVVGITTATDGSPQVTYDGRPLYYFVGDEAAGDTNGQGLNDVWFVATVDGLIHDMSSDMAEDEMAEDEMASEG
jgi:predicted lipoprotein with Yx(FWY)xxD motif